MRLYKSTLCLKSASGTPWQADTLFGHCCWSLVRHKGPDFLTNEFFAEYRRGKPPVLISDGFPSGWLPRPLGVKRNDQDALLPKAERITRYRTIKDGLEAHWLTVEEFNRARHGEFVQPKSQPHSAIRVVVKNQIDRLTNTAGSRAGTLYDFTELYLPQVDVYWRLAEGYEELVRDFLASLVDTGYGKRKSVGYGHVKSFTFEAFDKFPAIPDSNGFVTLSSFVPDGTDPKDGFWSTTVKYGKLGEERAVTGQPFKRPFIQLTVGSCFYDAPMQEWYGRFIPALTTDPSVMHYGYALPVSLCLPE